MPAGTNPPHGTPENEAHQAQTRQLLERAYLEATDPRAGSGFRGDANR